MRRIKRATHDLDDSLVNCQEQMTKYVNRVMGLNITMDFWVHDDFAELFGISAVEARRLARAFHASPEFADITPFPGVVEALREFAAVYDEQHVSTSRPAHLHALTPEFVTTHFPDIFSGVHFSNKYDEHLPKSSKSEIGRRLDATDHFEDVVSHIRDCATAYDRVFAVEFPWNRHVTDFPPNVHRIRHLREAMPIIRGRT